MNAYPINAIILFDMDVIVARKLYNCQKRIEKRTFKNAMRKAAEYGKPKQKRNFKRYGRGRP